MLQTVRNIEALIVTRNASSNPVSLPVFQAYLAGANAVRDEVALSGKLSHSSFEQFGSSPAWNQLQIRRYPTIIFIDIDNSRTITRLEGSHISPQAVSNALREISRLKKDAAGNYFDAEGNILASEASQDAVFTSPFGLGLFNIDIPPLLWVFGGLFAAKKALDSPTVTGQAGYGLLAFTAYNEYQKRK